METRQTKPHERNSILKKYYGFNGKPVVNSVEERPFDLDGNTFNSSKYFASLLKEKTLEELVKVDNSLVSEIREIDGDMKTLVYENYNKFISATDTIRRMRSNVENMESEMSRLNENITTISHQTKRINETLGPNRTKIQQLSSAHHSLQRLEFIFDLPRRLEYYADKGKYKQAIQYYTNASRVLDSISAFKGIGKECKAIMEKIKHDVWKSMENESVENTKLLILLEEDTCTLRKEYIRIQTSGLERNQEIQTAKDLILNYLMPLDEMAQKFSQLFLNGVPEIQKDLAEAMEPFINGFFDKVQILTQLPEKIPQEGAFKELDYLNQLKESIETSFITEIKERMNVFDLEWERQLICVVFETAHAGLEDRVTKFVEKQTDEMAEFVQDTQGWLMNHMNRSCLLPLKAYLPERKDFIREGLKTVWQEIVYTLQNVNAAQIMMFAVSRLCYDLADNSIFEVYTTFSYEFYGMGFRVPLHETLVSDMDTVVEQYSQAGQILLSQQIIREGYRMSSRIQEGYLYQKSKEGGVSPVLPELLNKLQGIEEAVRSVFPSPSVLISSVPDLGRFGMDTMMNYSIDKLFAERIEIYRKVEPTPTEVYLGLLIILLKSLLETTRMIQMDTTQFQQIQLDVEYIGQRVWPIAGEKKWTTTLLQEIVSSAYSRCTSPQSLDPNELANNLTFIKKPYL